MILITGSAGFIGFHLSNRLLQKGEYVIGIDNLNDYYDVKLKESRLEILKKHPTFEFINGDLVDDKLLDDIFKRHHPDIVVNLAAQAGVRYSIDHPKDYINSNIVGFFNILEACRHYNVGHLLFASSSSIYGNQTKVPFSENDTVDHPISLYAATKKSNELMAYSYSHLYKVPTTALRFFTVYGPFGRPDMAYYSFTEKIINGEPIKVYNHGDLLRDFTYVDDIVIGIECILSYPPDKSVLSDPFKIYNIGNNHPEKLLDFIEILEKHIGIKAIKDFCPMQPGDVYQTYADITELEKDFNFHPKTMLNDGLKKFVEWYTEYYSYK